MTTQRFIKEQAQFRETAKSFFEILFGKALQQNLGQIEIQIIPKNGYVETFYFGDIDEAVNKSHELCEAGVDVYFGVNPRIGGKGGKENVQWLTTFHADVDYGVEGHKKKSGHKDREDTQQAINDFQYRPTVLVHSGGGFHCYWILNDPVNVPDKNVTNDLELINKTLIQKLDGDVGTQNINRILRVPGTYNFKDPENPKKVLVIFNNGPKYDFHEFEPLIQTVKKEIKSENSKSKEVPAWDQDMATLPVSDKIKSLINHGNDGTYTSRSEADQAVITSLVNKGYVFPDIKMIFENCKIGEKYREHKSGDDYLKHNIEKAKEFSNLTEEERQNPLFICGALHKDNNGKYHLKIVPFQEYMNKKHMLKYLEKEKAFFRYNGQCYEQCHEER